MAAQAERRVPLSKLSTKYLHSNSTSHTSSFGAISGLIDNAYDPDVSAKQFWIDKTVIKENLCLTFMDNGNGLDHETMQRMLSFGYSDKKAVKGHKPKGMYGNGFKSGSMRLGKDAIVFSRSKSGMCIGMLSQTYLEKIGAEQIQIPIICIEERNFSDYLDRSTEPVFRTFCAILFSKHRGELLAELDAITSSFSEEQTGTRIIIWNLHRKIGNATEFDFETDCHDIRIPSEAISDHSRGSERTSYIPETVYSLRAYCSILYLKPRMQIILRGKKVKTVLIAKSLAYTRKTFYTPKFLVSLQRKRVPIIFGFNTKTKDQYGVMMYHKNRLIKAYERVGCQLRANNMGVGVIGIIECNFLDPTHNKQSFIESDIYRKTMSNLGVKLEEYWRETQYENKDKDPNTSIPVEDTVKGPDNYWVQCDQCLKWRKLPIDTDCSELPEKWFCQMNLDPEFRYVYIKSGVIWTPQDGPLYKQVHNWSCDIHEEPENYDDDQSGDDQPLYPKTNKQHKRADKKKKEKPTQQFPSIPTTSESVQESAERAESSLRTSSTIPQPGVSPFVSSELPVVSSIFLKSDSLNALKRAPTSPPSTSKRPKVSLPASISGTLEKRDTYAPSDVENADNTTNVSILESCSTPKPAKPVYDVSQVKKEKTEERENNVCKLDCTDDTAVDVPSEQTTPRCPTETLNSLKEEKPSLASECEKLRYQQQQADETRSQTRSVDFSAPTQAENPRGSAEPKIRFISEDRRSLIELRQNDWRLLVLCAPVLEPVQVDYESNNIDEILKKHLDRSDHKVSK